MGLVLTINVKYLMKSIVLFLWISIGCVLSVSGQGKLQPNAEGTATDSIPTIIDTTEIKRQGFLYRVFKADYPNPKKAAILSGIIPGAGQAYNKRWWKVPLVYGAMGGMVYLIDFNQSRYRRLRSALVKERAGEEHEFTGTSIGNERSLLSLRNRFDKNTQLSYIGFVFVYMLQSIEAFVDGHLKEFDIEEDLTFKVRPKLDFSPIANQPVIGLGLSIPLNRTTPTIPSP